MKIKYRKKHFIHGFWTFGFWQCKGRPTRYELGPATWDLTCDLGGGTWDSTLRDSRLTWDLPLWTWDLIGMKDLTITHAIFADYNSWQINSTIKYIKIFVIMTINSHNYITCSRKLTNYRSGSWKLFRCKMNTEVRTELSNAATLTNRQHSRKTTK